MDNSDGIAFYDKVGDLYNALDISLEQDADFTIDNLAALHDSFPYKSPVFRTNYYSFVFIKNGKGNYTTDEQKFEFESCTIYFTNPGHLKSFEIYSLKEGYLITLSETFLKTNVHKDIFRKFPFLLAETVSPQSLSKEKFKEFERLYLQIFSEYQSQSRYKYQIIGNLFVALLLKIKEQFWADYYPLEEGDRSSQIVKKFKQNLESHYRELTDGKTDTLMQVKDYAQWQHLSPNYLSNVIKSKTGKSISTWIAEKSIGQAKAFLEHSNQSIKEISFRLGYLETAHFSNFFKKHTGYSPSGYRKEFRK